MKSMTFVHAGEETGKETEKKANTNRRSRLGKSLINRTFIRIARGCSIKNGLSASELHKSRRCCNPFVRAV